MSGWQGEELVRQALAAAGAAEDAPPGAESRSARRPDAPPATHRLHIGPDWVTVAPVGVPLAAHGWKLHISSRAANFPDLAARLLPRLLAERCHFKLARSEEVLARMNGGRPAPAGVGKAVTVYPPASRVRRLGLDSRTAATTDSDVLTTLLAAEATDKGVEAAALELLPKVRGAFCLVF